MNREFGFDFEAGAAHRNGLHEPSGQGTVTGKHVTYAAPKKPTDEPSEACVTEPVPGAVSSRVSGLTPRKAHINPVRENWRNHSWSGLSVIGRIAIDEHVNICIDFRKHTAHDISLAPHFALPHLGPGPCRYGGGRIDGSVIVHDDPGVWQYGAKILNHPPNGLLFIETRDENCHARFCKAFGVPRLRVAVGPDAGVELPLSGGAQSIERVPLKWRRMVMHVASQTGRGRRPAPRGSR